MTFVYDEEKLAKLETLITEAAGEEVSYADAEALATELEFPTRSVSAKIRALGGTVTKKNASKEKWPEVEADIVADMIENKATDVEIAEKLGKTVKQVRGKALSMGLMDKLIRVTAVKPTKQYTEEDEARILEMVESGDFLEEIAEAMGKTKNQVRGKLLSMKLTAPQRDKKSATAKIYTDEVIAEITAMVEADETAEDIATTLELNLTGLKSRLGKLGLRTSDMGGKSKKYTDEDYETLETMITDWSDAESVAEVLNCSAQSVRIIAGKRGLKFSVKVAEAA